MFESDTLYGIFRRADARRPLGTVEGSRAQRWLCGVAALGLFLAVPHQADAQPTYNYTTFSVPNAFFTFAGGINDAGQVVGSSFDFSSGQTGFLLIDGNYTTLTAPGADTTFANAINGSGQIAGFYDEGFASPTHGFLLSGGTYTTFDAPGSTFTVGRGLNDAGQITGRYNTADGRSYGFLLDQGNFTTLDVPGASASYAGKINNAGQIVGQYDDANGITHGYLFDGTNYTALDVPSAVSTIAIGINDAGLIVGSYNDGMTTQAFLLSAGNYTTLNVPGAFWTEAIDINTSGQIVGDYMDANSNLILFIATPVPAFQITTASSAVSGTAFDVTVTALDTSGNINPSYQGTVTFSTSDSDSGVVLPAAYTFTTGGGGDNGVHTFSGGVTLITAGNQTLTITDTTNSITGSVTITVNPGP